MEVIIYLWVLKYCYIKLIFNICKIYLVIGIFREYDENFKCVKMVNIVIKLSFRNEIWFI